MRDPRPFCEYLGELVAATIEHVEVGPLPPDPAAAGYIELPKLPEYLSQRVR